MATSIVNQNHQYKLSDSDRDAIKKQFSDTGMGVISRPDICIVERQRQEFILQTGNDGTASFLH